MEQLILEQLSDIGARSVLQVGSSIWPDLQKACNKQSCSFHFQGFDTSLPAIRFDLAIVYEGLERQTKSFAIQLIGQLKNQHSNNLIVAMQANELWSNKDFISLGFKQDAVFCQASELRFYIYHLFDYNQKRNWNNAKHWANPDNFDRYRW